MYKSILNHGIELDEISVEQYRDYKFNSVFVVQFPYLREVYLSNKEFKKEWTTPLEDFGATYTMFGRPVIRIEE